MIQKPLILRNSLSTHSTKKVKESKLLVYLTCIYIIIWYLQAGYRVELLGTIRFEFLLGGFLSLSALVVMLDSNDKPTAIKLPVFLFLAILTFYTLFSYDQSTSWDVFYNRVFKFSMLALFISAFIKTPWALKMVVGAFLLAMLKLGQEGFMGWYTGGMIWENQGVPRLRGTTSLYGHPNSFSGMAVGCLPFIYFLYPAVKMKWQKFLLLLLLVFSTIIIVFTASRTGYVATCLLLIYAAIKFKGNHKFKFVISLILIALLSLPFIPAQYIERFDSIFTLEEAEGGSTNARITIIKDALDIASTKPWGIGVAAFPKVRFDAFGRKQDTHNLYLELLTNLSIIGFLAFFFLIKTLIKTNIDLQRDLSKIESDEAAFVQAVSKAVVGFILARLFLGLFGMDTYEIYWWFAIGLTIASQRAKDTILQYAKTDSKISIPTARHKFIGHQYLQAQRVKNKFFGISKSR